MNIVSLITENELKSLTSISTNNTITSPLRQIMYQCQLQYVKTLICEDLYNELVTQIGTNTLTPANVLLREAYLPMLSWYIYYEWLPFDYAKAREQSLVNQESPYGSPVSDTTLTYMRGQGKSFAERSEIEFKKWLLVNQDNYPLWSPDCGCGCSVCGNTPCICNIYNDTTFITI